MRRSLDIIVPASKSIANRALILSALKSGTTTLKGDFEADDIQIMVRALRQMGVEIQAKRNILKIRNTMAWRSNQRTLTLELSNSGTSMRFLTALCCLRNAVTTLTGNRRMEQRPIADLTEALTHLGATIQYMNQWGFPPLKITGDGRLRGGRVSIKGSVSSQFYSALLMISSSCDRGLKINLEGDLISRPYPNLTRSVMRTLSHSKVMTVEGDASAAVYWWAFGFLHDIAVKIRNLPSNTKQSDARFLSVLRMLRSNKGKRLILDMNDMPDSSLMLMALSALQPFVVKIVNIGSLRFKETDRISAMAAELVKIGASVSTGRDWIEIRGMKAMPTRPISIATYDDHRIAMSMAILGTRVPGLGIENPGCVNKTYPKFWNTLERIQKTR